MTVGFKCTYCFKLLRLTFATFTFETVILLAISVLGIVISHAGAVRHEKCFPWAKTVVSVTKHSQSDGVAHGTLEDDKVAVQSSLDLQEVLPNRHKRVDVFVLKCTTAIISVK